MKRKKFIFISLLYVGFFGLVGCSEEDLTLNEYNLKQDLPEQELKEFNIVQTNNGQKEWELEAKEAQIYKEKEQAITKDVKIKFFEKNAVVSILTAEKGIINSDSGDMEAEGNVVVNSLVEKTKLETEKLRYIAKDRKIISDNFIKYTKTDCIITGYGLEADSSLERVVIKRDVKTEIMEHKYIESKSEKKEKK